MSLTVTCTTCLGVVQVEEAIALEYGSHLNPTRYEMDMCETCFEKIFTNSMRQYTNNLARPQEGTAPVPPAKRRYWQEGRDFRQTGVVEFHCQHCPTVKSLIGLIRRHLTDAHRDIYER